MAGPDRRREQGTARIRSGIDDAAPEPPQSDRADEVRPRFRRTTGDPKLSMRGARHTARTRRKHKIALTTEPGGAPVSAAALGARPPPGSSWDTKCGCSEVWGPLAPAEVPSADSVRIHRRVSSSLNSVMHSTRSAAYPMAKQRRSLPAEEGAGAKIGLPTTNGQVTKDLSFNVVAIFRGRLRQWFLSIRSWAGRGT